MPSCCPIAANARAISVETKSATLETAGRNSAPNTGRAFGQGTLLHRVSCLQPCPWCLHPPRPQLTREASGEWVLSEGALSHFLELHFLLSRPLGTDLLARLLRAQGLLPYFTSNYKQSPPSVTPFCLFSCYLHTLIANHPRSFFQHSPHQQPRLISPTFNHNLLNHAFFDHCSTGAGRHCSCRRFCCRHIGLRSGRQEPERFLQDHCRLRSRFRRHLCRFWQQACSRLFCLRLQYCAADLAGCEEQGLPGHAGCLVRPLRAMDQILGLLIGAVSRRADYEDSFNADKLALAKYATQYPEQVYAVTVGSETLYRGNFTGPELLMKIRDIKSVLPNTKVGTADSWNKYADGTADAIIQGGVDILYVLLRGSSRDWH